MNVTQQEEFKLCDNNHLFYGSVHEQGMFGAGTYLLSVEVL